MAFVSACDRIDKEIFDGGRYLLNGVVRDARVLEPRFEFWNSLCCIVDYNMNSVAGQHQA
jgi:hypothetical protein